jgi:hypothetical protein
MIAPVCLLYWRPAVGALLGVRDQPQKVGSLFLVAHLSGSSGGKLCTSREPLLPQGARKRRVGLGRPAVPAKVVASAAVHRVGDWRGEAGGLPGLSLGLGEVYSPLASLKHLKVSLWAISGVSGVEFSYRVRAPLDGLVGLHKTVQVKFEKLPRHPRRHFCLNHGGRDDDVAAKGRAGDQVCLPLLDFTVEIIFPASE